MIITGIGARATPSDVLSQMEEIGRQLAANNYWVRSGHAQGADYAFEKGAGSHTIAYLPWAGFNSNLPLLGHSEVITSRKDREALVRGLHPNPDALSGGAWALMQRNTAQVLGLDLDTPSDFVVCWTEDGGPSGGTGMAIRLAERRDIPVINMFHEEWNSAEKVLARILS